MVFTALVCSNGWVALYGPDGKRLATYPPEPEAEPVYAGTIVLTQKFVRVDPKTNDFPEELS